MASCVTQRFFRHLHQSHFQNIQKSPSGILILATSNRPYTDWIVYKQRLSTPQSAYIHQRCFHVLAKTQRCLQQERIVPKLPLSDHCPASSESIDNKACQRRQASSALYVRHGDENVAVVEVDLNLEETLGNIPQLEADLNAREMQKAVNAYTLAADYKGLKNIRRKIKGLEAEKEQITSTVRDLVKNKQTERDDDQLQTLISKGKGLRKELKSVQGKLRDVEAKVMLRALKLPTPLHSSTPKEDTVIEEYGTKPEFRFRVKSHIELGRRTKTLKLSSVGEGAYYLRNELAILELDLVDTVSEILRQHGLTQFSCPDMVKTLVMESCGQEFNNPEKVYTLQAKLADLRAQEDRGREEDKLDITLHLCGGASPYSFAAYLAKMNLNEESLPLKCYSIGRSYNPARMERVVQRVRPPSQLHYAVTNFGPDTEMKNITKGLYSVPQATRIELFGACLTSEESTAMYEEYTSMLWKKYKNYDLPIRLVQMGSSSLGIQEGARREIQAWVPSLREYKKVANVGIWNDFVSRRLMIKSHNPKLPNMGKYLHTVHGTALSIPQLVAALIENNQTPEGRFHVSHKLHKSRVKCVYIHYMTPGNG